METKNMRLTRRDSGTYLVRDVDGSLVAALVPHATRSETILYSCAAAAAVRAFLVTASGVATGMDRVRLLRACDKQIGEACAAFPRA